MTKNYLLAALSLLLAITSFSQGPKTPISAAQQQIANFKISNSNFSKGSTAVNPPHGTPGHFCKGQDLTNKFIEDNGLEQQYALERAQLMQAAKNITSQQKALRGPIPVIFHIVYNTAAENIPYSTVQSYMDILNEDFQLLNSDAGGTHASANGFTPANTELSFCLAQTDPSGATLAEPGVERVSTTETFFDSDNGEENKMKQSPANGENGADAWPRADYINVWICDITNGASSGTAGYAYLPSNFITTWWDGIVIDYQLSTPAGRVLTHEMGHFLGLNHVWEGTGSGTCGDDDGLADTPFTSGPFFNHYGSLPFGWNCGDAASYCGAIETNYENFMDYSDCYNMFTQDQADVMNAVMSSTVGLRSSLLNSDKCNAAAPPVCNISASSTTINAGQSVDFFDNSSNNPDTWAWTFTGGSPGTSTVENPTGIVYAADGTYTVNFTATNGMGSCSSTLTINVVPFVSQGCDTITNLHDTNTVTIYGSNGGGYLAGVNQFGDLAKVEKFSYASSMAPYTHITGAQVYLYGVQDGGNNSVVSLVAYDATGAGGSPGTVIGSGTYLLSTINSALTAGPDGGTGIVSIPFTNPADVASGDFYVGIDFSGFGAGDSLGIVHDLATTNPNTAWEQWDDFTWNDMESAWGGVGTFSLFVKPYVTDVPVDANATATPSSVCIGETVTLDASSSVDATAYQWFTTPATPTTGTTASLDVTYSTAGIYQAYIFADGACGGQSLDSVTITVNELTVTQSTIDPSCAGGDGSITVTGTGGSGSYEYSINGGTAQPSSTFTSLSSGTYTILVTDLSSGCTGSNSVTLTASGAPILTAGSTDLTCVGNDGTITATATGGDGTYMYDIGGAPQSSGSFTGLSDGSYTVTVTDGLGCTNTQSVILATASGSLTVSTTNVDPSCAGSDGTITVSATGGSGNYEYSIDGGATTQGSNTFISQAAGTYNVSVTDLTSGCTGTTTATLSSTSGITTTSTTTDISCNGICDGEFIITATGGAGTYTFAIGTGTPQSSGTFSNQCAGSYVVTVDDGSCSTTTTVVITEPTQVTHTSTSGDASCGASDGSITVTGAGGCSTYTYSIDGGGTFQSSGSFNSLPAGIYDIQIMDCNGCVSAVSTVTVGGSGGITVSSTGSNETCSSSNGSISVTATGGTGTYQYSNDGGATFQSNGSFTSLSAGTFNIVVQDNNGCQGTTTETISNSGGVTATASANNTSVCQGDFIVISSSGGTNYSWSTGQSASTFSVTATVTTDYTVTVTDGFGCSDMATVTVTVNTPPSTTVTPDQSICAGETANLVGGGATSYFWNTTETTSTIAVSPTSTTTYTVVGSNGSCTGSSAQSTVTVLPSPNMVIDAPVTTIPAGQSISFSNSGSAVSTYNWNFGDGGTANTASTSHIYSIPGTYTVTLSGTLGSCTDTDQITIVVTNPNSIEENIDGVSFNIFPNPTNGIVNFELTNDNQEDIQVSIMDAVGKLILSESFSQKEVHTTFDISSQARGMYIIRLSTDKGISTKRIVLTK